MPPRGKCPLPAVPRSEAIKLLPRDNLLYLPSPATVLVGTLVRVRRCGGRRLVVWQSQPLLEEGRERLRETEEPSAGGDGAEGVGARAPGQSRPSAAHLLLPPRPAAAGHGRRLLTRARKQACQFGVQIARRAGPPTPRRPPPGGRTGAACRSRCVRHGGTAQAGSGSAARRPKARHGLSGFAARLPRRDRANGVHVAGQRERGDQFPRPWRGPQAGRHVYVTTGAREPAEIYRIALRVCDRARSVRYKYPSSSLSGNKMCARKGFSFMTSGLIECAQCIEFSRVPP